MVLDPLIQLIGELATRIDRHRQALSQSEALTRSALIEPLLRELGWNTEDPEQVQPEYGAGGGAADYGLLEHGKPQVLVEAKKLGSALSAALEQNIGYCIRTGAPYLVNTDGQRWEVYDIYKQGPIEDKRVVSYDIADADWVRTAVKALFLWRGNYRMVVAPRLVEIRSRPSPTPLPPVPVPKPTPIDGAHSLANFIPAPGSKPPTIVAPDGTAISSHKWSELFVRVVEWLQQKAKLGPSNCPVRRPGATRYIVATQNIHSDGTKFINPKQVGALYVETHQNTQQKVGDMLFLLRAVGEDPAKWLVQ